MQEKLRYLLKACTARYRRARAVEAVAVVMTAGACAAAVAQVAWSIAQVRPGAASAIAAIGAAVGIILLFGPIRKILALSRRQAFLCTAMMFVISLPVAACCLLGYTDAISRPALLTMSLLAAGLTGLLASYIYPPSQQQAAVFLDERCRLGERLSTAAELFGDCKLQIANCKLNDNGADTRATLNAQRWGCDDGATTRATSVSASDTPTGGSDKSIIGNRPENEELLGNRVCRTLSQTARQEPAHPTSNFDTCAQTVFEQALRAADEKDILHAPLWQRTRATAGALGLAILLGITLLLVPTSKPPDAAGSVGRDIVASLDEISPQKKRQLVEAFLAASTQPAQPAEVRQALKDAGMAASDNDPKALENALAILDRAGYKLKSILPVSTTSGNTGTEPNTVQSPTTTSPDKPPITPSAEKTGTDLVRVMNPDYKPIPAGAAQTPTDKTSLSQSSSEMLPWDTAWDIARARAANALAAGQVPPRYRQLVRDFFSADNTGGTTHE